MNSLFNFSSRAVELQHELATFMSAHVYPAEAEVATWDADSNTRWTAAPIIETLKAEAKKARLWNLFLPNKTHGAGLSNLDYAPLAEQMGRVLWASEVFNCNAPDTGNMELLAHFAST
ncbi:MAG: acyl-CoA dehydrogenase, partial [Arenimonas sp.]